MTRGRPLPQGFLRVRAYAALGMLLLLVGAGVAASLHDSARRPAALAAFGSALAAGALASVLAARIALALHGRLGWPAKRVYTVSLIALSATGWAGVAWAASPLSWRVGGLGILAGSLAVEVTRAFRAVAAERG